LTGSPNLTICYGSSYGIGNRPMTVRNLLSAAKVTSAKPAPGGQPKLYGDGGGLYLHVHRAKAGEKVHRSWIFRFKSPANGKTRDMGIGSADDCGLAEARDRAAALRKVLREGSDPIDTRETARAGQLRAAVLVSKASERTFEAVAEAAIAAMRSRWSVNGGSEAQWRQSLRDYAFPVLGKMPVDAIETSDVMRVIEPLWAEHRATADRVRNRIEKVLDRATAMKLSGGENPARWKGHLENLLARKAKEEIEHHKALPYGELPGFMSKLRAEPGLAARALEFCILTNARPGEVIGNNHGKPPMAWGEVDLDGATWTVPGSGPRKHKSGHIWRCPLSDRATEILTAIKPAEVDPAATVFAGLPIKEPLRLLRRLAGDFEVTVHGSDRSTFSDWAAEEHPSIPAEVRKLAVGHWLGDKVDQAYRRGDALRLRRRLSRLWDEFCAGRTDSAVVDIGERRIA
jgi:integrase